MSEKPRPPLLTNSNWIGDTPAESYLDVFLRNLDNPELIWEHAFRSQLSDRARHLLFVLTTMPTESLADHVELAFSAIHESQCAKYGMSRNTIDFRNALRELEGTFVAIRKAGESMLVRFQNPSIRDFMKGLLLGGELLSDTLASLVYFEQALWFSKTLNNDSPEISLSALAAEAGKVAGAMKKLFEAGSCSISISGPEGYESVAVHGVNRAARLAEIISASSKRQDGGDPPLSG